MAQISVTFQNNYSESRKWVIYDTGIDPTTPSLIFNDYLDINAATPPLQLQQDADGYQGHALYQRSDGAATNVDASDGDTVMME